MAHRLIVQVLITGTQVFGKAFAEAYRQASSASVRAGASQATRQRTGGVQLDEACKILDVDAGSLEIGKLEKKYGHLFNVNSKEKGGSFYLQSKVYRAMERLKYELELRGQPTSSAGSAGGAAGAEGSAAAK
ncbi:hypothetical protein DV113_002224 [Geotrichum candidum]|uniref:Mitochondrial import inner membrane translocase subunit TIM16 n=1 Tax=Geotrichum candidum TaxID=1173061 RepID=A0A0J9XEX7_GEOCN|nr:hypothetical protein DV454_002035 [Geotrichum candidum]KAF7499720.1 hypothetical protein DV113_002224 [Geotrichum candidum]KAI8134234.1 hypothetical protein DUD61_002139 [Geotrichum candidum]CDO55931.1 similar to Saccharomyces cerevisiae YJL104W PAM16 Constituent of the import motor (PAM complex) component of the Translocase of the Inner Mitochondrial membrane (TIM23 complex) [Geotrichum candidum]